MFREGKGGEREGEKHQCVVASHTPSVGNLACNAGTCPDWESNQWSFSSQASTQSTEPHQLGISWATPARVDFLYLIIALASQSFHGISSQASTFYFIRGRETLIGCLSHAPWLGTKPATQACGLTRNRTSNFLLCRTVLQSTEPHWSGGIGPQHFKCLTLCQLS